VSGRGLTGNLERVGDSTKAATATFSASTLDSLAEAFALPHRFASCPFAACLRYTKEFISLPASLLLWDKDAQNVLLRIQKGSAHCLALCHRYGASETATSITPEVMNDAGSGRLKFPQDKYCRDEAGSSARSTCSCQAQDLGGRANARDMP
jgi:hypothetical protein